MYFPSVRKQIREQCGHMDEGLYFLSKVNVTRTNVTVIVNGKLFTKDFWNGHVDQIVVMLNNYIKTGEWDTGIYFRVYGVEDVFRANSRKELEKWCKYHNYTCSQELVVSKKFIQISI